MNVYEWLASPDVREQAKAGRDPGLFADSKQGRGASKIAVEKTKNRPKRKSPPSGGGKTAKRRGEFSPSRSQHRGDVGCPP